MRQIVASPETEGRRLDIVIAELYPNLTRSSLEPLFEADQIYINGLPAKPSHRLRPGETIGIDESRLRKKPPAIKLKVVYEDDDVIVIDKPPGLLTHSKGALNTEATVASSIKPKIKDKALQGNRAGIVHRLDRGTSGVMVAAKKGAAQAFLQAQFSKRRVKKTYLAIVEGRVSPYEAIIDAPIARNPKKPQSFTVLASGKPARTRYKVLREFKRDKKTYSEVELMPETGRTHQLRIHLAYIGHPIVGDNLYGSKGDDLMLHATELELTLPSKQRKVFKVKLPKRFREFIES